MMLRQRIVSILAAQGLLIAAGCTNAPDKQVSCDIPNWQEQGLADASSGAQPDIIKNYQESCGTQFSGDNINAYKLGFFLGLQQFCSYENGFELGSKNNIKTYTCPMEQAEKFRQGQKDGYREYLAATGQDNSLTRVSRDFEHIKRQNTFDSNMGAGDGAWTSTFEPPTTGR
ncbi:DUF2799 domain-containing protein [Gilvimarinus sp. SDUM040013]|uniref:DUF2799 domain-containing protein n=1 Tax=Gilvimarinus gilvus TaxID=3058038 RepID=A0ABU4RWG7_9GAMM|nr:DUF2799 domain-containing protein [Gilvimarinus sp. SDUM040013]MDO3388606.1 DUF2799 domain-containing protein [Gilvimarinus sp. SDUM040013]MDX6848522.1 DUF2799 domain-containing protein [Gilvimarinus sp. SDUM040013]